MEPTEPLEGEGATNLNSGRPRPHVPPLLPHKQLWLTLFFYCGSFGEKHFPKAKQPELNGGFLKDEPPAKRRVRIWADLYRWKHFVHTPRQIHTPEPLTASAHSGFSHRVCVCRVL